MRVIVTGASGRLGRKLLPVLERQKECFGVARRPAANVTHCVDLNDANALAHIFGSLSPDCIVHAAALADVDACEADMVEAYRVNVKATANIVAWVEKHSPDTRLILISTDQVYDAPGPSREDSIQPRNVYALTKLWAEDLVRRAKNHLILRTNFFGAATRADDGQVGWLISHVQSGKPILLFADVLFNPLYVMDLAALIAEMAVSPLCGSFNLGSSGKGMSKADFFRVLAGALHLPGTTLQDCSVADLQLKAYRPRDMRMDTSSIEAALGRSLPDLHESITRLAREWREVNR